MNKSVLKLGLIISSVLLAITAGLWWFTWPDFQSSTPPNLLLRAFSNVLSVLTWPVGSLGLPIWVMPIVSLIQGFILALVANAVFKQKVAG